jgi:cytochrome c oxidase cbb3-type subunit 3
VRLSALALCVVALVACEREQRTLVQPPKTAEVVKSIRMNENLTAADVQAGNSYELNAQALADGKRLYTWFNCNGCHSQGGGGMGPPLMDDKWLYGSEPANIVATILEGRPNGMPAFGGRVNEAQAWQLAAYVRSLAGLVPKDAATSRSDTLTGRPAENRTDPQRPIVSTSPQ